MKIKKIFGSFNFMGNRLKNFKVDTPTQAEHPATKKYTDDLNKFDTASSSNDSTKFPWVTEVEDLPIKEVLDKLLYPVVYPEFKEIEYKNLSIESGETYISSLGGNNPINLFTDVLNQINFNFRLVLSDRVSTTLPKIKLTKFDQTENTITCDVSNGLYSVNVNMIIDEIEKIEIIVETTPSQPKTDSEGNPYIAPTFGINYTVKLDITEIFKNKINGFKSTRVFASDDVLLIDEYYDDVPASGEMIMHDIDFNRIKNLIGVTVNTDSQGIKHQKYILFVDKKLTERFDINFLGFNGNIDELSLTSKSNVTLKNSTNEIQGIYNAYLFEVSTILNILKIKFT